MEGNGNGTGGQEPSEVREPAAKSEQERVAEAIFNVAEPGGWDTLADSGKQKYLRMAEAAVGAAMPPLPPVDQPPYPASLLKELATELAYKYLNPGLFSEGMRDALDNYLAEAQEDTPDIVKKAITTL